MNTYSTFNSNLFYIYTFGQHHNKTSLISLFSQKINKNHKKKHSSLVRLNVRSTKQRGCQQHGCAQNSSYTQIFLKIYRCIYMYVAIYINSLYMLLYESFTLAMSKYILRYSHRTNVYIPNPNDSNLYKMAIRAVSRHKQTKHMHRAPDTSRDGRRGILSIS